MIAIEFLVWISIGLLGVNVAFLAIIYSILPLHITKKGTKYVSWSVIPSEITEKSKRSFISVAFSLLFEFLYILNEEITLLPNEQGYLQYVLFCESIVLVVIALIFFYKIVNMIQRDVIDRTNRGMMCMEEFLFGGPISETRRLVEKYGLVNRLKSMKRMSPYQLEKVVDELNYLERRERQPIDLLQLCEALSLIYGDKIPIPRIQENFKIEPKELDRLLTRLEKEKSIKVESNVVILKK